MITLINPLPTHKGLDSHWTIRNESVPKNLGTNKPQNKGLSFFITIRFCLISSMIMSSLQISSDVLVGTGDTYLPTCLVECHNLPNPNGRYCNHPFPSPTSYIRFGYKYGPLFCLTSVQSSWTELQGFISNTLFFSFIDFCTNLYVHYLKEGGGRFSLRNNLVEQNKRNPIILLVYKRRKKNKCENNR